MSRTTSHITPATRDERERMHDGHLRGGAARLMAPHVVYDDPECPHPGCQRRMQALDFRLENFGRNVRDPLCPKKGTVPLPVPFNSQRGHDLKGTFPFFGQRDPLVTAWWNDTGFAGTCPDCGGWIHFTIREKRAITAEEAKALPQLPPNWWDEALIL